MECVQRGSPPKKYGSPTIFALLLLTEASNRENSSHAGPHHNICIASCFADARAELIDHKQASHLIQVGWIHTRSDGEGLEALHQLRNGGMVQACRRQGKMGISRVTERRQMVEEEEAVAPAVSARNRECVDYKHTRDTNTQQA
jgi:hypothetical protein